MPQTDSGLWLIGAGSRMLAIFIISVSVDKMPILCNDISSR